MFLVILIKVYLCTRLDFGGGSLVFRPMACTALLIIGALSNSLDFRVVASTYVHVCACTDDREVACSLRTYVAPWASLYLLGRLSTSLG